MLPDQAMHRVEPVARNRTVHGAPIDIPSTRRFLDQKSVIRRPSRVLAGATYDRTTSHDRPFAARDGLLVRRDQGLRDALRIVVGERRALVAASPPRFRLRWLRSSSREELQRIADEEYYSPKARKKRESVR